MELYNEEILDLFDNTGSGSNKGKKSGIRIHEDANGNIYTVGITSQVVLSEDDTLQVLMMTMMMMMMIMMMMMMIMMMLL